MMKSTKTRRLTTTIAAVAIAACTFATLGMAKGMSAKAAEPAAAPAAGWYVVGNGAGTLSACSWTEYKPDFKLTQTEGTGNYLGTFTIENITLYGGDAFKLLYADGIWQWPNDSGWTSEYVGQFGNLDNTAGYFVDGGLGNIQLVNGEDGIYNFTLTVYEMEGTVTTYVIPNFVTSDVPPITQEEMYVVGSLANYPTCNWPGSIDVKTSCPALTYDATTKKWTATLDLAVGDQFKVYNLVNNGYFPSGTNNDCIITEADTYTIEYETKAPSFTVTNSAGVIVYQ